MKRSKRKLLKAITLGGSAATAFQIPRKWSKPIVDAVLLPSHAQTSGCSTQIVTTATTTSVSAVFCGCGNIADRIYFPLTIESGAVVIGAAQASNPNAGAPDYIGRIEFRTDPDEYFGTIFNPPGSGSFGGTGRSPNCSMVDGAYGVGPSPPNFGFRDTDGVLRNLSWTWSVTGTPPDVTILIDSFIVTTP